MRTLLRSCRSLCNHCRDHKSVHCTRSSSSCRRRTCVAAASEAASSQAVRSRSSDGDESNSDSPSQQQLLQPEPAGTFSVSLQDVAGKGKLRLDAFLAEQLPAASRAKIAASIKAGLITVNNAAANKPSRSVKRGDVINVALLPPEPCTAIPEAIPLDVVYEDDHLIVINKVPGMVVHISPGHSSGTLVNALLAHCGLPACAASVPSGSSSGSGSGSGGGGGGGGLYSAAAAAAAETAQGLVVLGGLLQEDDWDEGEDDTEEDEQPPANHSYSSASNMSRNSQITGSQQQQHHQGIIRPGIVHRLDRGTSGLMVVAKSDFCHAHLCEQFKQRSVSRLYNSITTGVPAAPAARVATNIVRDPANRLRMIAAPYAAEGRGRTAASNYTMLEVLAGGGAALVEWRLETGRTHQIRVHAKHIGHPLLGDDLYGPGHTAAARAVIGKRSSLAAAARAALEGFGRPALHAKTLGFTHPVTGARLKFDSEWPQDFLGLWQQLREWA